MAFKPLRFFTLEMQHVRFDTVINSISKSPCLPSTPLLSFHKHVAIWLKSYRKIAYVSVLVLGGLEINKSGAIRLIECQIGGNNVFGTITQVINQVRTLYITAVVLLSIEHSWLPPWSTSVVLRKPRLKVMKVAVCFDTKKQGELELVKTLME